MRQDSIKISFAKTLVIYTPVSFLIIKAVYFNNFGKIIPRGTGTAVSYFSALNYLIKLTENKVKLTYRAVN